MEFYRKELEWNVGIRVSIPNGMEFYKRPRGLKKGVKTFQFSTGWNSTCCSCCIIPEISVSIPNGMEFYFFRALPLTALRWGFNSQRDGILRKEFQLLRRSTNGFNSQRDGILLNRAVNHIVGGWGFNSQRDGILPRRWRTQCRGG